MNDSTAPAAPDSLKSGAYVARQRSRPETTRGRQPSDMDRHLAERVFPFPRQLVKVHQFADGHSVRFATVQDIVRTGDRPIGVGAMDDFDRCSRDQRSPGDDPNVPSGTTCCRDFLGHRFGLPATRNLPAGLSRLTDFQFTIATLQSISDANLSLDDSGEGQVFAKAARGKIEFGMLLTPRPIVDAWVAQNRLVGAAMVLRVSNLISDDSRCGNLHQRINRCFAKGARPSSRVQVPGRRITLGDDFSDLDRIDGNHLRYSGKRLERVDPVVHDDNLFNGQSSMPFARIIASVCLFAVLVTARPSSSWASDGDPVVIRIWPDGSVSVETHWNLMIRVLPANLPANVESPQSSDPNSRSVASGSMVDHVFSRQPNQNAASWKAASGKPESANAIHVTSMLNAGKRSGAMLIQVDGVGVVVLSDSQMEVAQVPATDATDSVDVVVVPASVKLAISDAMVDWVKSMNPRFVILEDQADESAATRLRDRIGGSKDMTRVDHNTFAISQKNDREDTIGLVRLGTEPWEMPAELQPLFSAMERSCGDSQKVFAKLSAGQMNFKPSNGTHTPRWNTEHMMGRQLLFFSQIYHEVDPAIPVIDLNPKQMPPDYSAAHPDWDGQEEARQMNRVSEFTRRFAYLLSGIKLDVRAPGSRWTLRGLMRQMERHYDEHTANTVKKFDLPDWPSH